MPDPKVVIAVGTDAISGGLVGPSYATRPAASRRSAGRRVVPGSRRARSAILHAILLALGRLPARCRQVSRGRADGALAAG